MTSAPKTEHVVVLLSSILMSESGENARHSFLMSSSVKHIQSAVIEN